eukprot:TRINITY_DN5714_c0_g2_i1.p1 TRINITY_DN5714_c0_g2~~TRINITY_DN5714_c0_g2_i1.p1  ORF type:complete len:543 (-),score=107.90 TRINITY_DN5714_c0_g2_i1:522-2150(-)
MRAFVERHFPSIARWLHIFGADDLLDIADSRLRLMLFGSCLISFFTGIAWIMDFAQFSCFQASPWTMGGIHEHTCLYHLVGGCVMIFMFFHSLTALLYYDEDGEELRQKKERALADLEKQCVDVLQRATGQARKLCGLLSADLGDKVREHVNRMRTILDKVKNDPSIMRADSGLHTKLVTSMAHHLHRLRQPALVQFEKLIALSGQSNFLVHTLDHERQQSMVQLLVGQESLIRTETMEASAADFFRGLLTFGQDQPLLARANSVNSRLKLPSEFDLREELVEASSNECTNSPEKVVLRPLRLVLRWFEKIEAKTIGKSRAIPGRVVYDSTAQQVGAVLQHLQKSPMYRMMLLGIACSVAFTFIEFSMMMNVIHNMRQGKCPGQYVVPCFFALGRNVVGMLAMLCYSVSLAVVLWNVDRLDAVLQVAQEMQELEDFKRQVDHLNAHDLHDEESSVSMIQIVEAQLTEQKHLVSGFFNKCWGKPVTIADYQALADDLEEALARQPARPVTPSIRGGKKEAAVSQEELTPLNSQTKPTAGFDMC